MTVTRPERPLPPIGSNEPAAVASTETMPERRARLSRELEFYAGRLAELAKLDPHDFTGLKRVYDGHLHRTRAALATCGE